MKVALNLVLKMSTYLMIRLLQWTVPFIPIAVAAYLFLTPPANGQEIENIKEHLIVKSERNALIQINKLIKRAKDKKQIPELLVRKAGLYQRAGQSAKYFSFQRAQQGPPTLLPAVTANLEVKKALAKAYSIYKKILIQYPKFDRQDEVLFNMAFISQEMGRPNQAKSLFLRVEKDFKESQLINEARLAAAEIEFDQGQFVNALAIYSRIDNNEKTINYTYGQYKKAWCNYNLQNYQVGLNLLTKLIQKSNKSPNPSQNSILYNEILNDTVLFFSEQTPWQQAIRFFANLTPRHLPLLHRLGEIYKYRSEESKQIQLYHQIAKKYQNTNELTEFYKSLILIYSKNHQMKKAVSTLMQMRDRCESGCFKSFIYLSNYWASQWHKQSKHSKQMSEAASKAYQIYFSKKVEDEAYLKTLFQYAELLFSTDQYLQASELYEKVALYQTSNEQKKTASHSALVAFEKHLTKRNWKKREIKRYQSLRELYAKNQGSLPHLFNIDYKLADQLFLQNKSAQTKNLWFKLSNPTKHYQRVEKQSISSQQVSVAQDRYLQLLNQDEDYPAISKFAKKWQKNASPERQKRLQAIFETASFSQINRAINGKQYDLALPLLEKFIQTSKAPELLKEAFWLRIRAKFEVGDAHNASLNAIQFYKEYPTAKNASFAIEKAIVYYESTVQIAKAARALEVYAQYSKNKTHLLETAAGYYKLSNQTKKSLNLFSTLIQSSLQNNRTANKSWIQNVFSLSRRNALSVAENIRSNKTFKSLENLEQAQQAFVAGNFQLSFSLLKKSLRHLPSNRHRAQARLLQAKILHKEFNRQSMLSSKSNRLALVLSIKSEKLKKAQQAYKETIEYNDAETSTSSFLSLAKLYLDYVVDAQKFKAPDDLSNEDKEKIKQHIQKITIPLEDKAAEILAEGIQLSERLTIFNKDLVELKSLAASINKQKNTYAISNRAITPLALLPTYKGTQ